MAASRCPRSQCTGSSFELKEMKPDGSRFKFAAIQCAECGAVVGVESWVNPGNALEKLARHFGVTLG